TVAGNYTVTATISDGNGGVLTSTAAITVNAASTGGGGTPGGGGGSGGSGGSGATAPTDTDNDGFADEIDEDDDNDGVSDANESLDGTNSLSASSVNKLPMTITKLRGIAKFGVGGKDGYQLSGILPNVPAGLNPFGQIVSIDFAGAPRTFTLDSKGRARATGGSFQLKLKGKRNKLTKLVDYAGGDIPFKATVKGTFVEAWADEGITPEASGKLPLAFSVEMIFNGRVYAGTVSAVFSAKTGTGGSFQSAKPPKK
ncbi:MAG TPA: hypothetical protein VEK08_06145, partial [Planctomycetota bacterium]|nr:hypothetical protein [Planctomycetota bacterium]